MAKRRAGNDQMARKVGVSALRRKVISLYNVFNDVSRIELINFVFMRHSMMFLI